MNRGGGERHAHKCLTADLPLTARNHYSRFGTKGMRRAEPHLRRTRSLYVATALLAIVVVGLSAWLNWNRVSVRNYEMNVAFDGKAPWGIVGPESESEIAPTVLYRKAGQSYCYTAFQLPILRDRLEREKNRMSPSSTTCSRPLAMKAGTPCAPWTALRWRSAVGSSRTLESSEDRSS